MSKKSSTVTSEPAAPLRGEKLLKAAVNQILRHPDTWNQATWHSECGTKHCIAGWCQILSGNKVPTCDVWRDAQAALDISSADASWLFSGDRSLREIYHFAKNFSVAGFNRDGFNREGFNRDGFNRAGLDRAGFDREGFNRAGFDRDGFNRAGFNYAGFDRDGQKLQPFDL